MTSSMGFDFDAATGAPDATLALSARVVTAGVSMLMGAGDSRAGVID